MVERVTPRRLMSVEEYLEFERNSPVKHEYVGGHVYAMTGVSRRHSRIAGNVFRRLADAADGTPCRVHQSDMQVPTPDGPFYYPDVVVACGEEPDDPYIENEPCLLVEVLSPNTASIDRREKLLAYRRLESLGGVPDRRTGLGTGRAAFPGRKRPVADQPHRRGAHLRPLPAGRTAYACRGLRGVVGSP